MKASLGCLLCAMPLSFALAQTPLAFRPLSAPSMLTPATRATIQQKAAPYEFEGFTLFAKDSAVLVFVDSSLTAFGLNSHTWMFGPPVTEAEADSCPPEKVLARKIARTFWRSWGRPADVQYVIIAVRGTKESDRWTAANLYFTKSQLERAWAGDPASR